MFRVYQNDAASVELPSLIMKLLLLVFIAIAPFLAKIRNTCADVSLLPLWARVLIVIFVTALCMWDTAIGILAVLFVTSLFVTCSYSYLPHDMKENA